MYTQWHDSVVICTKKWWCSQSEESEESEESVWNQSSHVSRSDSFSDSESPDVLATVELLCLCLLYSLRGFWLTLLPVEQSLHHRFTAASAERLLKVGPSVLTSSKSFRVEQLRLVLLSFLIIFSVEKKRSTLAVEKGKLRSSSLTNIMFGHFVESGEQYNWYQTLL